MIFEKPILYIDADGCPLKNEICAVAERHKIHAWFVANRALSLNLSLCVHSQLVPQGPDVADDWIAERADENSIVITSDLPLAGRCLERGARVLDSRGRVLDDDNIGTALGMRNLSYELRDLGFETGGPKPYDAKMRGKFLSKLDAEIWALKRKA